MSGDDKRLTDYSIFEKKNIVVTVKMDGENTTMYNDYIHARSLSASDHLSRDYVKGIWGKISYMLDDDMRLCGENMFALHTVKYDNLESYFLLFSIWVRDTCLSWKETQDYATILGLKTVPVIYEGVYDLQQIEEAFKNYGVNNPTEGYVIRLVDEFRYFNFKNSVAKYVKPEFMVDLKKRDGHWQQMKVVPNKILK